MTADIKLLPLPEADDSVENHAQWPIVIDSDVWLQKSVQDYARACVVHATAAKDAEIARWKEMAEWQGAMTKALLPYQDEEVAGRAELAGLLDEVRSHFTRDDDLPSGLLPRIDAALRDHKQETKK